MASIFRSLCRPLALQQTRAALNKFGAPLYCHQYVVQKSRVKLRFNLAYAKSYTINQTTGAVEQRRFLYQVISGESAIPQQSTPLPLSSLERYDDDKCLKITWNNGDSQTYPYPWLRDNCRCDSCYSHSTYSRTACFLDLDVEAVPQDVALSSDGNSLDIKWPDGHTSEYPTSWLLENRFSKSEDDHIFHPKFRYWANDLDKPHFKFSDIIEKDSVLSEMLMELKTSGICHITDAGNQEGRVKKIADRVAFLHLTYFG